MGRGWKRIALDADTAPVPYPTGVSQILEVQRQPGQVAHPDAANPKQPCLSVDLRGLQAGMPQPQEQTEPLRPLPQAAHQRFPISLRPASANAGCRVTSVIENHLQARFPDETKSERYTT